jgi:hypothetical protein
VQTGCLLERGGRGSYIWIRGGMTHGSLGLRSRGHGDEHQHGNDTLIQCIRMYISILWVLGILQRLYKAVD